MSRRAAFLAALLALTTVALRAAVTATILAGDEFGVPVDRPSLRLDPETGQSRYAAVGALEMISGGRTYVGTGVAIAPGWVLTAGHNVDFNDDGVADSGLVSNFHLPGFGVIAVAEAFTAPAFTGFGNPSIHHDLALLRLVMPLSSSLVYPGLGGGVAVGDVVTLVGFGRSGFGSYGYTTASSLVNRRIGFNTLESIQLEPGGGGRLFRFTFHAPDDPRSLGNDRETIIGPGDSGGPAIIETADGLVIVGINTFTEGFGGRFGDIGGGVLLDQANLDWIQSLTGIPEPSSAWLVVWTVSFWVFRRRVA